MVTVNTVSSAPFVEVVVAFSGSPGVPPVAFVLIQAGLPGQVVDEVGAVQLVKYRMRLDL
jgi:hypothetical protein